LRRSTVPTIARRDNAHPHPAFPCRPLSRRGFLDPSAAQGNPPMLPVKVGTPTVVPMQEGGSTAKRARSERTGGVIEIELSNGHRVRVQGAVDANALKRVIGVLVRR